MNRRSQSDETATDLRAGGIRRRVTAVAVCVMASLLSAHPPPHPAWRSLPDLPGGIGFAGLYAGVSHGVLLAAGGANFLPPAGGGDPVKTWHDDVHLLRAGANAWEPAGKLPRRGAYGVSATWENRIVCVAGSAESGAFAEAWTMEWTTSGLRIETLPPLPVVAEMAAGAVVEDMLYVAVDDARAAPTIIRLLALDLKLTGSERRWRELPGPADAPGRKLAVAAAADGRFYLLGGLAVAEDGRARHLRDAHAFTPGQGWRRLSDLPRGNAGAAGPALVLADGRLVIWGGLDAPWVELSRTRKFFETDFLVYDPAVDRWSTLPQGVEDQMRFPSRLTASVAAWQGGYAILGGETAPRIRTATTPWVGFR